MIAVADGDTVQVVYFKDKRGSNLTKTDDLLIYNYNTRTWKLEVLW